MKSQILAILLVSLSFSMNMEFSSENVQFDEVTKTQNYENDLVLPSFQMSRIVYGKGETMEDQEKYLQLIQSIIDGYRNGTNQANRNRIIGLEQLKIAYRKLSNIRVEKFKKGIIDRQYMIARYTGQKKILFAAFRGTVNNKNQFANMKANLKNFQIDGVNVNFHKGFYDTLYLSEEKEGLNSQGEFYDYLAKEYDEFQPDLIIFTGHSLGGALAEIAGALSQINPRMIDLKDKIRVYTFGAPRPGDEGLSDFYKKDFDQQCFRITYKKDFVPHLPPKNASILKSKFFAPCVEVHYEADHIEEVQSFQLNDNDTRGLFKTAWEALCSKCVTHHLNFFGTEINNKDLFNKAKETKQEFQNRMNEDMQKIKKNVNIINQMKDPSQIFDPIKRAESMGTLTSNENTQDIDKQTWRRRKMKIRKQRRQLLRSARKRH